MDGLWYIEVEQVIQDALGVTEKGLPKFQARIRNLRRKCVPELPKPGMGRQIIYSASNIRHLYLALIFHGSGTAPEAIANIFRDAPADEWSEKVKARPDDTYFVGFWNAAHTESSAGGRMPVVFVTDYGDAFWHGLKFAGVQGTIMPFTVLDLTTAFNHLDQCLEKIRKEKNDGEY